MGRRGGAGRAVTGLRSIGARLPGPCPGKLCASPADPNRAKRAKFANMRESRPLGFARWSPSVRAAGAQQGRGGGETAMWRKRREEKTRPGRRGLFAWLMDRRASAPVPWAASPDAEVFTEGRPSGAMPRVYCARCGRPNPDGARFCSFCGAQLASAVPGAARPGETTSTLSPVGRPEDGDFGDDLFPDSAAFGALPEGSAMLLVMRAQR